MPPDGWRGPDQGHHHKENLGQSLRHCRETPAESGGQDARPGVPLLGPGGVERSPLQPHRRAGEEGARLQDRRAECRVGERGPYGTIGECGAIGGTVIFVSEVTGTTPQS